jgi:hypothetical protein
LNPFWGFLGGIIAVCIEYFDSALPDKDKLLDDICNMIINKLKGNALPIKDKVEIIRQLSARERIARQLKSKIIDLAKAETNEGLKNAVNDFIGHIIDAQPGGSAVGGGGEVK